MNGGGSYFILSIYATLCSLYIQCAEALHLVQTALSAVGWFNLGDDFALANCSTTIMTVTAWGRRQWDPGIPMVRLPVQAPYRSIEFDCFINVNVTSRRQRHPGITKHSNVDPSTRVRRQWDPGIAKDGIDRSFYYCHPVLSRPTVPNIKLTLPSVQELPPCLPFGVCCCIRLPVSNHIMCPCCVSIRQTTQQQMFGEPSIHPPWGDFFYLGADIVTLPLELSHAPSIYVYSGHDNWFYFYLRIGSLTLIIGWLKLWGTVGFPIPHGDSAMCPSLVIQSTFHVQPSTFE